MRQPRITVHDQPDHIDVVFSAARDASVMWLLPLWLGGWMPMGRAIAGELSLPGDAGAAGFLFELAWLAIWLVGSLWVIGTLLWSAFGVERIRFASGSVALVRQIACFRLCLLYRPDDMRLLRVQRVLRLVSAASETDAYKLAFDYRGHTVSFGCGIAACDANRLVRQICARVPCLA